MDAFPTPDIDTLHLRSHAEGICRDCHTILNDGAVALKMLSREWEWLELYAYSLDILCLMALTEALGLEYGGFVTG